MESEMILLIGEEWMTRVPRLGPPGLATVLVALVPALLVQMAIISLVFSSVSSGCEGCKERLLCSEWAFPIINLINLICPYRISSSNNWISRLLTSWDFLIHKVTANGNGSIILLAVKMSGECSPSLMNLWNYLHWNLRKILLAVTINTNNYDRLSLLNNPKFHETSLLGTHFT